MDFNIKYPEDILNIPREKIGQVLFNYLFGYREKVGPRFKVTDSLVVPSGKLYGNKEAFKTSMGNYLVNFALFNENILKVVGYQENKMGKDVLEGISSKVANALLNDKITAKDMIDYLDKLQFFGFGLNSTVSPSLTEKTMFPIKEVIDKKKELEKKYKNELEKGDPITTDKMEKELLNLADKIIGNDPGKELYSSGSKASFGNNYKLMNVMKGAVRNFDGSYTVSTSNYTEGIKKEETHIFANAMVEGAYMKGVGTQQGGYLVKKYIAAFQSIVLDEQHSDCGTKQTVKVVITPFLKKMLLYRNINVNGKIINLTEDNIDKYVGREVQLYDPIYCMGDKICNKCAGELYYKLGIMNIGNTSSRICSTIMNKSLKKFHDNSVKIYKIDKLDDLIL